MRAYVYFTQNKFNLGSVLDGDDIIETIFGEQMRESEDHAFIEIETLSGYTKIIIHFMK